MTLAAGTRLGNYEITGLLGVGGMGEVYRARDGKLGRDVALKVLPEALGSDAGRVSRFEREARLLASVNHPGIAAIYGAEESGDTRYLVLELVGGETLSDRLRRTISPVDALRIARQIAEALEAAHERGIIHRDLKPSNVMVTPEGRVKLLDLGLAKMMGNLKADADAVSQEITVPPMEDTRPGVIMGTVEFMSPEQARGKTIDKRTDIWAFGCVLFECFSGRRAFAGESVSDALASILLREPDWSALPADTPPAIRELLLRCLQKDPNQRLRDIGDARLAIEEVLSEVEPRRSSASGVLRKPARGRRRTALIAAAAVAAVSIGIFLWRFPRRRSGGTKSVAVLPFKDLSGTAGGQLIGDGLAETVSARLANLPGIQVMTPVSAVNVSDRESDPSRVASRLGAGYLLRGSIQRSGDRIRITYSVWSARDGAQIAGDAIDGSDTDLFGIQDRLAERVGTSLAVRRAKVSPRSSGLETAGEQDRYLQAIGCLQRYDRPGSIDKAIALLEDLAENAPSSALVQAALARAYIHKFDQTRSVDFVSRAERSIERAERLDPDLPEVYMTAGVLQTRKGNPQEAVPAFERALAREPSNFEALSGLADALEASDRMADAERAYRRAIELWPSYWAGYSNLAAFQAGRGRYREAADNFRRVTSLVPDNFRAYGNLGGVELLVGDFEEAIDSFQKSLSLARSVGLPVPATTYANLGTAEFFQGQYAKAAEAFEAATRLTPDHYQIWSNLGDARRWAPGMRAAAAEAYARAMLLCRKELEINAKNPMAHSTLALCLAKTGHGEEAERHASESLVLDGKNPEILYNAAIVSNLVGKTAEAVDRIRLALGAGYSKVFVEREPELADLRAAGKLSF